MKMMSSQIPDTLISGLVFIDEMNDGALHHVVQFSLHGMNRHIADQPKRWTVGKQSDFFFRYNIIVFTHMNLHLLGNEISLQWLGNVYAQFEHNLLLIISMQYKKQEQKLTKNIWGEVESFFVLNNTKVINRGHNVFE